MRPVHQPRPPRKQCLSTISCGHTVTASNQNNFFGPFDPQPKISGKGEPVVNMLHHPTAKITQCKSVLTPSCYRKGQYCGTSSPFISKRDLRKVAWTEMISAMKGSEYELQLPGMVTWVGLYADPSRTVINAIKKFRVEMIQ